MLPKYLLGLVIAMDFLWQFPRLQCFHNECNQCLPSPLKELNLAAPKTPRMAIVAAIQVQVDKVTRVANEDLQVVPQAWVVL